MQKVLVDTGQLLTEHLIQYIDDGFVPFHGVSFLAATSYAGLFTF
jgi:hypothetical protein